MKRDKDCEKCSKFSHCNNNDLFCEKFVQKQLKGWKEEQEYNKKKLNKLFKTCNKVLENLEKFDYCKTGNEQYLIEQIEVSRKTNIQNLIDIKTIIY